MSLDKGSKFSCFIIGGGTLPIRCAEILLRNGHEIRAIASSDPEIKKWTKENNISYLLPDSNLAEQIDKPFDYLFSIVNEHILREDILQLPQKLAINYHDALLPKYAGTHATSWALMNGEILHGISWHVITKVVDAGDILKQRSVEISENDTALTLNTKCYEAAIKAFSELVEDLSNENVILQKQDLENRTFFPRFKRPSKGGVISWNKSASEISALVRALNFGNHPNPLGVAKLFIENEFLIVSGLDVLDSNANSVAGTINEIGKDFLRVSTADKEVILREILLLEGQPIPISDLRKKYNLCVGFQFQNIDSEMAQQIENNYKVICKHESYWVKKLSSSEPATLPFPINTVKTEPIFETLPIVSNEDVLSFNSKTSCSIMAAFGAFLARLKGSDIFDVGYSDYQTNNKIGQLQNLFANQVPLRFTVDCQLNFADFLKITEEEVRSIKNNQTYSYDLLARFPLLKLEEKYTTSVVFAKVEKIEDFHPAYGTELVLLISESESVGCWIYDRNRIDAENVEKLNRHFITFLNGIVDNPESKIAYLPLLTEAENQHLLVGLNDNWLEYPKEKCIQHLFEAQVERSPDSTALIFGEERLTYRELNNRANQLAHYLQTLAIGAEDFVGICVERSVAMIVGILGILKAGGTYIPLDPAYPKDRVMYMLEDSQASVLLTQQKLVSEVNGQQAKIVCLDTDWEKISKQSKENPVSSVSPNNLAYIIYTSGSTGKPKGVAIEHRNTVAFLTWATSVFSQQQLQGTLASTSVCFDLSVYEMFAPLSCGGTIILVENVLHLPSAPAANEVTLINSVPSAMTELLRIKGVPSSVKTVNLAGEPLKTSLVRQIYELVNIKEVFDLYGPSEDTTYSTFTLRDTGKATIGRPIANTQAYILDRWLQPVPIGIPGELYLGGDGLARGYLNRRELTEERFIKNLFNEKNGERLYKTGDLVRYLNDGRIEYLGRIDNQVKIRGFRIELGEIETMLLSYSDLEEAVVIAREDTPGDKRLVAYFVALAGLEKIKTNDLRDYLKQKLPDYMIPSAFVELEEMPLTPNGKINRKALPPPAVNLSEEGRDFVAHRDDFESKLVKIWENILGVHPIGVQDNFFELGGHSLQAIRMFAEVEDTFNKNIPLATLFEAGTIEKLAEILRQEGWAEPESSIVPIQTEGTKPIFFCIHAKGGNVLFYRDLAKHLGKDQPFYGIQARRLAGRQVGHATVEEMAEFYIKEIQTIQPEGPYFIGGSSFGGLAAFEIAQQLHQKGEKVGLLALFDTGTPDYPKMLPNTTALRLKSYELIRRFQHHRDSLKAFNFKERTDYVFDKLNKVKLQFRRKINNAFKKAARKFYLKTKGAGSIPKNYIQIEDQIWKAGQKYEPQVYSGKMTLFRASNQPLGIQPDDTLGWANLVTGGIEIHEVPGHHGSIVTEPYVRVLSQELSKCLSLARINMNEAFEENKQNNTDNNELVKIAGIHSV